MRIIGRPIASQETASSRIRFFNLLKHLPSDFKYELFRRNTDCDILYVQKDAFQNTIDLVKKFKGNGVPVVYDIDDDFGVWPNMREKEMIKIVDLVTTNTSARVNYLKEFTDVEVKIVPDGIDYISGSTLAIDIKENIERIITFGNDGSIMSAAKYMSFIEGYRKSYIGSSPGFIKGCDFLRWSLSGFLDSLREFDICVLAHNGDQTGRMKSNNRLLVCMYLGIPTIVSDTESYGNMMRDVGFEFLIAKTPSDVPDIIESIKEKSNRDFISNKFIEHSRSAYNPKTPSLILAGLFSGLINS